MGKQGSAPSLPTIGWREWITLPQLGVAAIKAKVDTGARSSSLHAFDLKYIRPRGKPFVAFKIHPFQNDIRETIDAEAELVEYRRVRSSSGHVTLRPVIVTEVQLLEKRFLVELTLASRDTMGFRMLLGRGALRNRFLVDVGRSMAGGIPDAVQLKKRRHARRIRRRRDGDRP